jgi:ABC-type thiamin/hydroxymethylpyrimidine transport system permease subunit
MRYIKISASFTLLFIAFCVTAVAFPVSILSRILVETFVYLEKLNNKLH